MPLLRVENSTYEFEIHLATLKKNTQNIEISYLYIKKLNVKNSSGRYLVCFEIWNTQNVAVKKGKHLTKL